MVGRLALLACALWLDTAVAAERAKTDIVTLQNGDRITCRILYLKYGLLQVNSAHTGSISIEWPSVCLEPLLPAPWAQLLGITERAPT
jgi:hypothetical protein